jgi:glucose/arabinose dehydrogenase
MNRYVLGWALLSTTVSIGWVFAQDGPDSVIRGTKQFRKSVLVSGLAGPWEIAWGPDNMLWVTERTGKRVTRIDPATGNRSVAITIEEVSAPGSQDGLLGMALQPELLRGSGQDYVYVATRTWMRKEGRMWVWGY